MNFKSIGLNAAVATALVAGSALAMAPVQAATIFNFGINLPPVSQANFGFTQDGITVIATGDRNGAANVVRGVGGLGVAGTNALTNAQIDGTQNVFEKLNLNFSKAVQILSVTFGRVGFNDRFTLTASGFSTGGSLSATTLGTPLANLIAAGFDLGGDTQAFSTPFSTAFSFSVPNTISGSGLGGNGRDYSIAALTVEEAAPIPTPALLPGLLALGAGVLRKRKAEATEEVKADA